MITMINYLLNGLTLKQYRVLGFIVSFMQCNGYSPSVREIGLGFRIAPSSVLDYLRILEKKGFIKRSRMKSRSVKVIRSANGYGSDVSLS
jgi:SOS-response transcriptional repressor LexA